MKPAIIEMAPRVARTEAERYANARGLTKTDRQIMRAYKSIAHGGKIIKLDETMRLGGYENSLPKLAICRADASRVDLRIHYGRMEFSGDNGYYQKKMVTVPGFAGLAADVTTWAKLPYIPPYIRRPHMENFFVLWEATWQRVPKGDPFLLERIEANLFRIVTGWDISPVEAAILRR